MPSHTVLSRSHTTHLMDCFSFFFAAITAAGSDARFESIMACSSKLPELEARDRELLNLGAPFDDLHHLGVAEVARHREVFVAAVAAVDLDRVGGCFRGGGGGEVLG